MTRYLYVLVVILSALVTVWCSFSWTLCLAIFLAFSLLLLLQQQRGGVRVRQEKKWCADNINDSTLEKIHKENNSIVDQEDNNSYKDHSYLKRKNSVNRSTNHDETLGSETEDEENPGSLFYTTNTRRTTTIISIMSNLEKSITNSRLMSSLLSVFNKGSNSENDRPVSPPGRHNNKGERKNGRQANTSNRRRMAVGGDGRTPHMSPSSCRSDTSSSLRIIGGSSLYRGRINTGYYEIGRTNTVRHGGSNRSSSSPMIIHPQRRKGRFAKSPVTPPSSPLPRFHRTACESPDRPGINPVGFTLHALQRPEVCYPSNSSPGILPHVRLEKRIKIPLIESNMNRMSPVTVRIAPPEMGVHHSPKFTSLQRNLNFPLTPDTNDVLSALREGTRKRTNVCGSDEDSIFESANNTAKRRRQESNHSTASSSSLPSLPDFLPDLSLCNFTPSSYMSPTSRYMVPSSALNSSNGTVTHSSSVLMAGSSGVNSAVKRPVAPCGHLSPSENSPNSKRPRQEVKNNSILSSLSSSQRYWLHQKDPIKRKFLDSPELQDSTTSKENQEAHSNDNQQSEKTTSKFGRSVSESANSDTEANQTSVSIATPDCQSDEMQASTDASESKTTPDLRSRRKHLSFATPSINLDRLSYANVYATKQDYENDRKAEQERVEKMLDRIATEKETPDADLLSEKNVVGNSEDGHQPSSVLTVPSTTQSSTSSALTCTTAATSLIVSTTAASLTSSSSSISSSLLAPKTTSSESSSSTSAPSTTQAVTSSIFSSSVPTTTKAVLPSTSPLSSLLQATSTSTSTLTTPSSTTSSSTTVPQTTTPAGFLPSSTKPTETSTSLSSTSLASATTSTPPFQPMFGSPAAAAATTTSANSPNIGGLQFEIKTASAPSSSSSSSIPSTTSSRLATNVTTSGFSLGTFNSTSATPATASTTTSGFAFGASAASSPQTSAFTTPPAATTNVGSLMFSSPSKDLSKPGGFSFNLINPRTTPTSPVAQKPDGQPVASPFSTPKPLIPSTTSSSSSSLFPFASTSAQTFTTASTTSTSLPFGTAAVTAPSAAASTTPAPGVFAFAKSTTPASLPQSSTPPSSTIPTTGMFAFKPSDTDTSKTSAASIPTSNQTTGIFAFKASADSTSAVTTQASSDQGFVFGGSGTNTNLPAFGSSSKPPPVFGASTSASTFGSISSNFGATSATSTPKFGATSTSAPAFNATSVAPPPSFGAATTPTFGAATKPTFGTTSSTSTPVFGASPASTTPAFAPPSSATSTIFGSTDKSKPLFGATSSPFGASSTASTAFGGSTTTFGAPSNTSTLFGASASQSNQANASSTGAFAFDTNANTARQTSTTTAPMTGFNFAFNSAPGSKNTFAFGGGTSSSTTTAAATATTTTAASTAAAGSTSIFGQASSTFSGFSSAGQDGQKSMFGSATTNQSGFNFSGASANQTTSVFGQTAQQPQGSLFASSDQQPASQPFTFGQGSTPGNTSTPFGQSSAFSSPQASSFGSFGAKPPANVFASPTNNSDKPSQPTPNIFGSAPVSAATPPNVTAQPKPLFGQVASQPFGAASRTATTTGNTGLFGTTATGQASTPAGGSPAPGIFTFGQSAGTQQPTATTTNPNPGFDFSASLGGASQFNFGQGGVPSKSTMFNMGSGSTAPKMRSFYLKARRRGAKK